MRPVPGGAGWRNAAECWVVDTNLLVDRFEYEDWHVRIYMTRDSAERYLAGRAELFCEGVFRCRIALAKGFFTEDEATASLRRRAKEFIADWRERAHGADSEFSEL
jgi:hypothetical protein